MYGNSGPNLLEKIQEQPEEAEAQQETRVMENKDAIPGEQRIAAGQPEAPAQGTTGGGTHPEAVPSQT